MSSTVPYLLAAGPKVHKVWSFSREQMSRPRRMNRRGRKERKENPEKPLRPLRRGAAAPLR